MGHVVEQRVSALWSSLATSLFPPPRRRFEYIAGNDDIVKFTKSICLCDQGYIFKM